MTWRKDGPQGNEAAKIRWELVPYTRGSVLDLGCGPFKAFPHFTGVDNGHHDQAFGWQNRADVVVDTCENLSLFASQSHDAVFSSHLLEHIEDYKSALREWWRVIKPGGHLCLYLPHKDFYPNIGEEGANPDHKHDFSNEDIIESMMSLGGWDLVRDEVRGNGDEYSFFQVYKKMHGKQQTYSCRAPKPEKTCAVVRYGAYGDMIMASSVMPWLKEQGYHVTLYCAETGYEVIKHDPHVDRFIVQAKDQVPQPALLEFWEHERPKYDKWINLSESVECALLPPDDRSHFYWPDQMRRKYLDRNYLEFTHEIADVPMPPRPGVYLKPEERAWARFQKSRINGPAIVWSLSGSSVHKAWPHMDAVIARIMLEMPQARVVLVGGTLDKILQCGWENEPRVMKRAGEWTIRESIAFCEQADLVIGTETGLLNAASTMDVAKIICLSHSSPNNLTKHWRNTKVLVPSESVHCYPCHRMHHSFKHCWRDDSTGVAKCMADISASEMWNAICEVMQWRRAAA